MGYKRLTEKCWRNLDPWECCGQDDYCERGCHEKGGCIGGCVVPRNYKRLAAYEDSGLSPEEIQFLQQENMQLKRENKVLWQEKQDMFREVLRLSREEQDYVIQYDSTTDGEG